MPFHPILRLAVWGCFSYLYSAYIHLTPYTLHRTPYTIHSASIRASCRYNPRHRATICGSHCTSVHGYRAPFIWLFARLMLRTVHCATYCGMFCSCIHTSKESRGGRLGLDLKRLWSWRHWSTTSQSQSS